MPRNPLSPPLTTAAVIAETKLGNAHMSPAARVAAARAAAAAMTPAERAAVAERNQAKLDEAAQKLNASATAVHGPGARQLAKDGEQRSAGVPRSCPRCGAEARGNSETERGSWFSQHYNDRHPGVHGGHR